MIESHHLKVLDVFVRILPDVRSAQAIHLPTQVDCQLQLALRQSTLTILVIVFAKRPE